MAERYAKGLASSDELFEAAEAVRNVAFVSEFYASVAGDPLDPTGWPRPYDWDLRATGEAAAAVWYSCEGPADLLRSPGQASLTIAVLGGRDDEEDAGEQAAQALMLREFVPDPFGR